MSDRARDALALAAWTVFLVTALFGLHAIGDGPLAGPPWPGVAGWIDARDAPTIVFALLRVVLLGVGWYLLAATLLATALRFVHADTAAGAVEACTPAPVRRLVRAAAGLSIAASVVAVSAAAASEGDDAVTMRRLPDVPADVAVEVTMRRLPDVEPVAPAVAETPPRTHVVAPGEHLWSIAERSLEEAWQRTPTDAEVDPYWRRLIEQNRPLLPNPADPDLIVPALRLELPPLPPKPTP